MPERDTPSVAHADARREDIPARLPCFLPLAAFLILTFLPWPLAAQTQAELRVTPLDPAVEEALSDFVDKAAEPKTTELTGHMTTVIEAIDESAKLSDEERAALEQAAEVAVAAAVETWKPRFVEKMRPFLAGQDFEDAREELIDGGWEAGAIIKNQLTHGCTLPDELPVWKKTLETVLGPDRFAAWDAIAVEKRAKEKKTIVEHLENWAGRARKPLDEALSRQIDAITKALSLPNDRTEAMRAKAAALMDRIAENELARVIEMFLFITNDRLEQRLKGKGANEKFDAYRPITQSPEWMRIVEESLSKKESANWEKHLAEEKEKQERMFTELLKPSLERTRFELEKLMKTEVGDLTLVLGLPKKRQKDFMALFEKAIDSSCDAASVEWKKNLRRMETPQLNLMKEQGGAYFGLDQDLNPVKQAVWKEGLEKMLSADEQARVRKEIDKRAERHRDAIARIMLAELDKQIAFTAEQRAKLAPILRERADEMPEHDHSGHFSYSTGQLFETAGGANPEEIRAILDDIQWDRWETVCQLKKGDESAASNRQSAEDKPGAGPAKGPKPEAPDIESVLSEHLYDKGVAKRTSLLTTMTVRVEDAERVLSLSPEVVAELHTAAKGAVEEDMLSWKGNMERYTRSAISGATRQNVAQLLQGRRVSYSTSSGGPDGKEIWKETVKRLLTEEQRQAWQKELDAREEYFVDSIAAVSLNMLDQRRRLTAEQVQELRPLIDGVLEEYQQDIRRYLSHSWYMQSYYACLPLAGIPEKDVKAVMTAAQWDGCQEQDLPQAMMYWDNIKQYHDQRVKNDGKNNPGNVRRVIFE